jgi:hypothetical protein
MYSIHVPLLECLTPAQAIFSVHAMLPLAIPTSFHVSDYLCLYWDTSRIQWLSLPLQAWQERLQAVQFWAGTLGRAGTV